MAVVEQQQKPLPQFDRRILGDTNFDKLDSENRTNFIIERVFDRGANYSQMVDERIHLFATAILNNKESDYRCYKQAQ
ncbi:MAG: hypothetical protein LBS25_04260, partial [Candidatus Symbiothrix sp.]|nr:hypothetical protein [Candidatus Symbiothrix sp.]